MRFLIDTFWVLIVLVFDIRAILIHYLSIFVFSDDRRYVRRMARVRIVF